MRNEFPLAEAIHKCSSILVDVTEERPSALTSDTVKRTAFAATERTPVRARREPAHLLAHFGDVAPDP